MVRVTVWNEFFHERHNAEIAKIYPDSMHVVIAGALRRSGFSEVRTATLPEASQGLPPEVLQTTDVI